MACIGSSILEAAPRPQGLAPSGTMLDTAAGPLEVAIVGPDDGRPLIIVDHAMGSCSALLHIAEALADHGHGRKVIAWSRPGCGNSPTMPDYAGMDSIHVESRIVLPALMAALELTAADFLGYGDGATIAMTFAALNPARADRVVAIAPHSFVDEQSGLLYQSMPESERESGLSARLGSRHADAEATYRRWRLRRLSERLSGWSAVSGLAAMTAPLLLIQGTRDEFNSPEQMRAVADAVSGPVNWVFLQNKGHFLLRDVPEQIISLVNVHLEDGWRRTRLHS